MNKKQTLSTGAAFGDNKSLWYDEQNRADKFKKIEACFSSLEAAKAFVLSTSFVFDKTGDKEVDKYVGDLVRVNDLKSMNFLSFMKNVLEFIHYGVSITKISWKNDQNGLPYPAESIRISPSRLRYEDGKYIDNYTGKPFDMTKYYIAVESITDKGFETGLLDALESVCKNVFEINKTLPPAIRKYKNQPKIGVATATGNESTDESNCKTIAAHISSMDENSTAVVTGLERIFPGIMADIDKLQNVQDKQEMKILRAYIGHSELLAGSGTGNNTKMIKIMEIAEHYKRFRVSVLEKCINELLTNLVWGRFGFNYDIPYLRFLIDTEQKAEQKKPAEKSLPDTNMEMV